MMYTLQQARDLVRRFVDNGSCDNATVDKRIFEAVERLTDHSDFEVMRAIVRIGVKDLAFTLPWDVEKLIAVAVDGQHARVWGQTYQFLSAGPGDLDWGCVCTPWPDLLEQGEFPLQFDIPKTYQWPNPDNPSKLDCFEVPEGMRLAAFAESPSDVGKKLRIEGFRDSGAEVLESVGPQGEEIPVNRWQEGVEGMVDDSGRDRMLLSENKFVDIRSIVKPDTEGYVTLYGVDHVQEKPVVVDEGTSEDPGWVPGDEDLSIGGKPDDWESPTPEEEELMPEAEPEPEAGGGGVPDYGGGGQGGYRALGAPDTEPGPGDWDYLDPLPPVPEWQEYDWDGDGVASGVPPIAPVSMLKRERGGTAFHAYLAFPGSRSVTRSVTRDTDVFTAWAVNVQPASGWDAKAWKEQSWGTVASALMAQLGYHNGERKFPAEYVPTVIHPQEADGRVIMTWKRSDGSTYAKLAFWPNSSAPLGYTVSAFPLNAPMSNLERAAANYWTYMFAWKGVRTFAGKAVPTGNRLWRGLFNAWGIIRLPDGGVPTDLSGVEVRLYSDTGQFVTAVSSLIPSNVGWRVYDLNSNTTYTARYKGLTYYIRPDAETKHSYNNAGPTTTTAFPLRRINGTAPAGAFVTLTNSEGRVWRAEASPDGDWSVDGVWGGFTAEAVAPGYTFPAPAERGWDEDDAIDFTPDSAPYDISGVVRNADGDVFYENVAITATNTEGRSQSVLTAGNGEWSMTGVWGDVTVTAARSGWTFDRARWDVDAARSDLDFVPEIGPITAHGLIVDDAGDPLQGARMVVVAFNNDGTPASGVDIPDAYADATGRWEAAELDSAYLYEVTPVLTGYAVAPTDQAVLLHAGDNGTITLYKKYQAVVNAEDTDGQPLAGVTFDFLPASPASGSGNGWRWGPFTVEASLPGYWFAPGQVDGTGWTLSFLGHPVSTHSGTATDGDSDEPLQHVTITASTEAVLPGGYIVPEPVVTGPDGLWEIEGLLDEAEWVFTAERKQWRVVEEGPDFVLRETYGLYGRVETSGGEPLGGVQVTVEQDGRDIWYGETTETGDWSASGFLDRATVRFQAPDWRFTPATILVDWYSASCNSVAYRVRRNVRVEVPKPRYFFSFLGKYHPRQNTPMFRRYSIMKWNPESECCRNVLALVKMRAVPLGAPTDILPIDSLQALKLMVMAISEENKNNLQLSSALEQQALGVMVRRDASRVRSSGIPEIVNIEHRTSLGRFMDRRGMVL